MEKNANELLNEAVRKHPDCSMVEDHTREDLMKMLNGTYLARRFFGKSQSWFSQKLNRIIVHGKQQDFTPEELERLRQALHTMATEIDEIAFDLQ